VTQYRVRLEGFDTGQEGVYHFDDRADLMNGPADEVVEAFFAYANRAIFEHEHVSYELNGVMKHKGRNVVIGMGILNMQGHTDGLPFTITINPASAG
jgi:hypothetical protein